MQSLFEPVKNVLLLLQQLNIFEIRFSLQLILQVSAEHKH